MEQSGRNYVFVKSHLLEIYKILKSALIVNQLINLLNSYGDNPCKVLTEGIDVCKTFYI